MKINTIIKNLKKAEAEVVKWKKIKAVHERCAEADIGDLPEAAYRAYIVTGSVSDSAKMFNDRGWKFEGHRKYLGTDISHIINTVEIEDQELMEVVRLLYSDARKVIDRKYN